MSRSTRPFHPGTPWELFRFETPELTPETPAEEPERPEWLPENFESPEALAAAYKESQRAIHERSQRIKDLEGAEQRAQEWEEWARAQQQQQQGPQDDPRERLAEILLDPDRQADLVLSMVSEINDLKQQVARTGQPDPALNEISAELAQEAMRSKFPDWDEYAQQVSEVVNENPRILGLTEESRLSDLKSGLESVFYMVRGRSALAAQQETSEQAAAQQQATRQAAQTMSGAGVRPATLSDDEQYWDRVRSAQSGGYGS